MRYLVVTAAILGSCYSPAWENTQCGDDGACPSGMACGLANICVPEGDIQSLPGEDIDAPLVTVAFPAQAGLTDASIIEIRGTASDASGISALRINGTPVDTVDGYNRWRAIVPLEHDLENRLVIESEDTLGNIDPAAAQIDIRHYPFVFHDPSALTWDDVNNRILVADQSRVLAIDGTTAERALLSDSSASPGIVIDHGARIVWDEDVAKNRAIVLGNDGSIVSVDGSTGQRATMATPSSPSPMDLAWDSSSSRALTVAFSARYLHSLDEATGVYTELTGSGTIFGNTSVKRVTWDPDGNQAIVVDENNGLYRVTVDSVPVQYSRFSTGAIDASGIILDNDRALVAGKGQVRAVSLLNGIHTILSDSGTGVGPPLLELRSIAWDAGARRAIVLDENRTLVMIDGTSGDRALFSEAVVGTGPHIVTGASMAWDVAGNRVLIVDTFHKEVMAVDGSTGNRFVFSGPSAGLGPPFGSPKALTVDPVNNRAFIVDDGALFVIDGATGDRAMISDTATGVGPQISNPNDIAWDGANNRVLVAGANDILAVDVATGNRSLFSANGGSSITWDRTNNRALVADGGTVATIDDTGLDRIEIFEDPFGSGDTLKIVRDETGQRLFCVYREYGLVVEIDDNTRQLEIVSDSRPSRLIGAGPRPRLVDSAAWDASNQRLLLSDGQLLFAVDVGTGDRFILSGII